MEVDNELVDLIWYMREHAPLSTEEELQIGELARLADGKPQGTRALSLAWWRHRAEKLGLLESTS